MGLVISLLVFLLVIVIANYIVDQITLPANVKNVVKLILGVIFLIVLLEQVGLFSGRF